MRLFLRRLAWALAVLTCFTGPSAIAQDAGEETGIAAVQGADGAAPPASWPDAIRALGTGDSLEFDPVLLGFSEVSPPAEVEEAIARAGLVLKELGPEHFSVRIDGHADPVGSSFQNEFIAIARAVHASKLLLGDAELDSFASFKVEGFGATRLADPEAPSNPMNRRVAIAVTRVSAPPGPDAGDKAPASPPQPELPDSAKEPGAEAQLSFAGGGARQFGIADQRLIGATVGAIDLWFEPDWAEAPEHDPAVFSVMGPEGVRFSLHVLADRSGLAVWNGTAEGYQAYDIDLSATGLRHVSLVTLGDLTFVTLNGQTFTEPLDLGYSQAEPVALILGGGPEGADPFTGRVAQLRIWWRAVSPRDWPGLAGLTGVPGLHDPLRADLALILARDGATRAPVLETVPALVEPVPGWWAPSGYGEARILNRDRFEAGEMPPVFTPEQQVYAEAVAGTTVSLDVGRDAEKIAEAADGLQHPHFTHAPLFRLVPDPGIDPEAYRLPEALRGDSRIGRDITPERRVAGRWIETAEGIQALRVFSCPPEGEPAPVICLLGKDDAFRGFRLEPEEYVRGVQWSRNDEGLLAAFRLFTNRGILPRGTDPLTDPDYSAYLPDGVRPDAILAHVRAEGVRPVGIELVPPPEIARPALTLYTDTGAAERFTREGIDTFLALSRRPEILSSLGRSGADYPTLRFDSAGTARIEGFPFDLRHVEERPAAARKTAFNDTFVTLSKAVNLQANYVGYDILQMDPLHLVKTGAHRRIFEMPDGDERDYYDANRIFIPRGLLYTPEYTGKNDSTVTTSDTYAEFHSSLSNTVSAGISSKVLGSFSFSTTMKQARAAISENKVSRTLGLSRAIFYDLVLDKSHMRLSDAFRRDVARLAERGDLEGFVEVYGTHYPTAVVYGGLGVLQIDATESMREKMHKEGISMKVEASAVLDAETKSKASIGFESDKERGETFRSVVGSQHESFFWIGGTHAGAEHSSWTVGPDGVVPVHVSLRPIDELLSPVYFDDPEITVRLRSELKRFLDTRLAEAGRGLPAGSSDPYWMVEVRIDGVACTDLDDDSTVRPSASTASIKQFPMIFISMEREGRLNEQSLPGIPDRKLRDLIREARKTARGTLPLRNYVEGYAEAGSADDGNQAIPVQCPSHANILKKSPYLQANNLARFRVHQDDLRKVTTKVKIIDRRDLEHWVVYPPENFSDAETGTAAFLAGLTLGISVFFDEYLTEDGSPLVPKDGDLPPPKYYALIKPGLKGLLCAVRPGLPRCGKLGPDDLDRLSGHWFPHSHVFTYDDCLTCQPRRVDYSVRILQ